MSKGVSIVVEVPDGSYCARFSEFGLVDRCPLLQRCQTCEGSFYCPVANMDTHCGQDNIGILKQRDYYDSVCPSLYQKRIMELLRELHGKQD